MFYYADEFNLSWFPTLRAMWSPKGQQVMIPIPGQPDKYYGIGAVNYHTGENVVLFERRKRRQEIAQLLSILVEKHPTGTIYVTWDQTPVCMRTMRLRRLYKPLLAVWYCSTCRLTAPGSILSKCCAAFSQRSDAL